MDISVTGRCDRTYDTENKLLFYPGLSTNTSLGCSWEIIVPIDKTIKLTFINFNVEASGNCTESYLQIMDGNRKNETDIGEKLCGVVSPDEYESSRRSLILIFTSVNEINTRQFTIGYNIAGIIYPSVGFENLIN